jgi:hypothetical protein
MVDLLHTPLWICEVYVLYVNVMRAKETEEIRTKIVWIFEFRVVVVDNI